MAFLHDIKEAFHGHGHDCTCDECMQEHHHDHHGLDAVMVWRIVLAGTLLIGGGVAEHYLPPLAVWLHVASILCAGYDVFIRAVANIFRKRLFDESLLMSVVAAASIVIGESGEGASVMVLYQLGELFQGYAVAKVRQNIEGLMENRSPEASAVLSDVRSGHGEKGWTEEFITHFARIYTPVVLAIAFLIALLSPLVLHTTVVDGIYRALVLMVIACPCAIVISVPLSYFAGVGGATRQGILFKSTGAMDDVARVRTVVFDKSGALQDEGRRVTSVKSERMDAEVVLRIAAHACAYADDPYAEAIKTAYKGVIYIELIQSFQQQDGGITVEVGGVNIALGPLAFVRKIGVDPGADVSEEEAYYLAIHGVYAGRIIFGGTVKPDVPGAVAVLSWDREVVMITDESPAAAEKFARQTGIEKVYPNCSEKVAIVQQMQTRQLKRGRLMFVGSAETDGDCIRESDIGVSLYGADSDAAIQAADVVIMDGAPSRVVTAIAAAKHTRAIVWQNIVFALAFKLIILVLDMLDACPLWLAVFADVGVALLAILNSLRAFVMKEPFIPKED